MSEKHIFLVGPMGVGKTTIGKQLAGLLHRRFVDIDAEIETRCGADIPWIFDMEGEQGFRKRESKVLADIISNSSSSVIAITELELLEIMSARTFDSLLRKPCSPSMSKIQGISAPHRVSISASISTNRRCNRPANCLPIVVLPTPMGPTKKICFSLIFNIKTDCLITALVIEIIIFTSKAIETPNTY